MTLIEEAQHAARGCLAILRGDAEAHRYFNLTPHGLAGALLAVVLATGLQVLIPFPAAEDAAPALSPVSELLLTTLTLGALVAVLYWFLRLTRRGERLVGFLVVYAWGNVFGTLIAIAMTLLGFGEIAVLLGLGVLMLYFFVRAAMILLDLPILMVVGLIGALVFAQLVMLMLTAPLFVSPNSFPQ